MKLKWIGCLLVVVLFFHFSDVAAQEKSLVFFTDEHKEGGYLEAITKEAFQRVGYKVDIKYVPWKRALQKVMEGQHEALMAAAYTEERAEKMAYTESIGQMEMVFFKKKTSDITYSTLEDLKAYVIGMIRGATISEEFDAADYLQKEEVASPEMNIKKLLAGRVDLIVEQRKVILNYLRNHFPDESESLVALEPPLKILKYHNAFSKGYPNYAQKVKNFNTGLQRIKQDGTYQKLREEYAHP